MFFTQREDYNPAMEFHEKNFWTAQGSTTDFLGFDNGFRAIPTKEKPIFRQFW